MHDSKAEVFSIANYRLVELDQSSQPNTATDPAKKFNYMNEQYLISSDYGQITVGNQIVQLTRIRYNLPLELSQCIVTLKIVLENKQKEISKKTCQFQYQKQSDNIFDLPHITRIEELDPHIFHFNISYKFKPNQQLYNNQIISQEEQFYEKKFRISPTLPFDMKPKLHTNLAPIYFLEYTCTNISLKPIPWKKIDFITESPFQSQLIRSEESINNVLQPTETEKFVFQITVRPNQQNIYDQLLVSLQQIKDEQKKEAKKDVNLGSLFIEWGQCGVQVGQTVTLTLFPQFIQLAVNIAPESGADFYMEEQSFIELELTSPSNRFLNLRVIIKQNNLDSIKIIGTDKNLLQIKQDEKKVRVKIFFIAYMCGLQRLNGIIFMNGLEEVEYMNRLYVNIKNSRANERLAVNPKVPKADNNFDLLQMSPENQAPVELI